MAYTDIDKPSDYFNTKLYTGDDTNNRQISLDWSPDLTWIKARNIAYGHVWYDRVRGIGKTISSFLANSEDTNANGWSNSGCTTNSFTVDRGSNETLNESGRPMVAWNWLAGGTGVSNTQGSITSTVSANTTAGFSIVTWSGSGTNDQTIGHGLGVAPSFIIHKNRTYGSGAATGHWIVKTKEKINSSGTGSILYLNQTNAYSDNVHGTLIPSGSTLLQVKGGSGSPSDFWVNASGSNYVAYCFAEKQGFSKFGSYTGNGSADGTFVYTGFKPAFVITKEVSGGDGGSWILYDNKRTPNNVVNKILLPNGSNAEITQDSLDLLSNGFKIRTTNTDINTSGANHIYMAFAENPFTTSTGIPTTAR